MTRDDHKRRLMIVCTCDRLQWTAGGVKRRSGSMATGRCWACDATGEGARRAGRSEVIGEATVIGSR